MTETETLKTYGPYKVQWVGINLPSGVRKKLNLKNGDLAIWIIDNEDRCILKKATIKIEP